jgi:hypothetical protein
VRTLARQQRPWPGTFVVGEERTGVRAVRDAADGEHRIVVRNWLFGFRTPRTLRDHDAWYRATAVFGRAMVFAGWLTGLASAALLLLGYSADDDTVAIVVVSLMMVPLLAGLVAGFRAAAGDEDASPDPR